MDKIESGVQIENGIRVSDEMKPDDANHLIYSVDDIPPWHWSLLLGFQVHSNINNSLELHGNSNKRKRQMQYTQMII